MIDDATIPVSGARGPLRAGERVALTDPKGNRKWVVLAPGKVFHTTKGGVAHDDIIGHDDGLVVTSVGGMSFTVFRPVLQQFMVSMPREAAVIYPKDAAHIVVFADIFPGARVLEAGVGSGALSLALLRAIGPGGHLVSYERRPDFAAVAQANVATFLGPQPQWDVIVGDLVECLTGDGGADGEGMGKSDVRNQSAVTGTADGPAHPRSLSEMPAPPPSVNQFDRAVLDMLAPWECIDAVGEMLAPGGVLCCYVTTTTQMGRVADQLRAHGGFTEPDIDEVTVREWHAEGLAVRPGHGTTGHTGFLVLTRRLAPGVHAPLRRRRPAQGAYGPDYTGPMPKNVIITE